MYYVLTELGPSSNKRDTFVAELYILDMWTFIVPGVVHELSFLFTRVFVGERTAEGLLLNK